MKKITLSLLAVAFLFSCKKDEDTVAVNWTADETTPVDTIADYRHAWFPYSLS